MAPFYHSTLRGQLFNNTENKVTYVIKHNLAATENKPTAGHELSAALHKAATAELKFATILYGLAVDCLRVSMHFFHPIQQCAQQVYHTAVPLSPTSSHIHKSYLQSVIDNQLSHATTFSGAPSTWGSLLRTIDVRPRQLTCIATFIHGIVSACGNIVDIYDAVTGVLRQSLCAPEIVAKIQHSPDGSMLFFAHLSSVTMWDIQTGGLIRTFTPQSKISDIAVSTTHLACGLFDGSVIFWNVFTNVEEGKCFWSGDPVVAIHWLSAQEFAVLNQNTLSIQNVDIGRTSDWLQIPGNVWGMVHLDGKGEFLVGTSQPNQGVAQEERIFMAIKYIPLKQNNQSLDSECLEPNWVEYWQRGRGLPGPKLEYSEFSGQFIHLWQSSAHSQRLLNPTVIHKEIVCITPPNGVQSFNSDTKDWANNPPLLGTAASVAMSSNRNLVVQTKDSIQIFSIDVLASGETHNNVHLSHVYPLGENYIICVLQSTRNLTLFKLETMQEIHPHNTSQLKSFLIDQSVSPGALFGSGLASEFGVSEVVEMWQSGTPLPELTEATQEDPPLHGWSPERTRVIKVYGSPRWELRIQDQKEGFALVSLPLEGGDFGAGDIYDITFDSETRFHLKINKLDWHVQISCDVIPLPSGGYSHTINKGEAVPLSQPRAIPPYTLDANCEWVLDAKSRRVCWISPSDIRRGSGGHFWAGLSLVMVGGDGVVRKVTFKDPAGEV